MNEKSSPFQSPAAEPCEPILSRFSASVHQGLLGWSNKRSGVEFYRYDEKVIPRHGSEWGDLLAQDDGIDGQEGCPVIVVVLPRVATSEDVIAAAAAVKRAVGEC